MNNNQNDDMLELYDFSEGVRGKHAEAMANGYTITINHPDGTTTEEVVTPTENTVVIEDDILSYFPDSASVNHALRTLVSLFPEKE